MEVQNVPRTIELRKANVLFEYDHVLKDPDAFILKTVAIHYPKKFAEYINIPKINTMTYDTLSSELVLRREEDVLKWASLKPFDFQKNYEYLYKKFKNMYRDSRELSMYGSVRTFSHAYCIGSVYIWNRTDDIRQRLDLVNAVGKSEVIKYVTGPLDKVIRQLKPSMVYHHSAKVVADLNEYEDFPNTYFAVANYQYNFEDESTFYLKYDLPKRKNITIFRVMDAKNANLYRG